MQKALLGLFSQELAVDLGTSNTLVYVRGRGVVLREPSIIAVQEDRHGARQVLAVGMAARAMLGRTPADIQSIRPIRDGVIADFEATEAMLRNFLARAMGRGNWVGPRVVMSIPYGTTEVERRAVRECGEAAGARDIRLIEVPIAAALGADLNVSEPHGNMVVDLGGGTTEVAVLSMNGIVYSRSIRVGGDELDNAVVRYLEGQHRLLVGPRTAENAKICLGSALAGGEVVRLAVKGRDLESGYPRTVEVDSDEIRVALQPALKQITDAILGSLEKTPPELVSDIVDKGIVLTGGGALLRNIDDAIRQATGLPVVIAEEPLSTVVMGAGRAICEGNRFTSLLV